MAMQGTSDGFVGALAFLNTARAGMLAHSEELPMRSQRMAETLLRSDTTRLNAQSRAQALAFVDRHEEAVLAYEDALDEVASLGADVSSDTVAMLHFKHSCALARAGRDTAALNALERAVTIDRAWADEAREEESWERFSQVPRFLAIVRASPSCPPARPSWPR